MVYQLKKSDIDKAAQVLGESFWDYPVSKFIFPNEHIKKSKISYVHASMVKLGMHNGFVNAPSKNIEGVAVWIDSSIKGSPLLDGLKAGIFSLFCAIDIKSFIRLLKIVSKNEKVRDDILKGQNCYILESIGVDPQYQKQGFAHKLIIAGLKSADEMEIPCYLETSNPANIDFYKKYNFLQVHKFEKFSIKTYCLYRESKINA